MTENHEIKTPPGPPLVSLVVNDLAENAFGRAYLLGKMLEEEFRVEVVGFAGGPTWVPCADHGWPEKRLPWPGRNRRRVRRLKVYRTESGNWVVQRFKGLGFIRRCWFFLYSPRGRPRLGSFGAAALMKSSSKGCFQRREACFRPSTLASFSQAFASALCDYQITVGTSGRL